MVPPEVDLIALKDDEANWKWDFRGGWTEPTDDLELNQYQQFYKAWRVGDEAARPSKFETKFPYELSFGDSPPPYLSNQPSILVTETYETLLRRILRIRQRDKTGDEKGIVLLGQPGTGKSTFLKFMLAWLIAAQQVVVLYYNDIAWLFFRGKVYQPSSRAFRNLPQYRKGYYPIWTLIDMDSKTPPPLEMNGSNVWPIQATPPNPDRWEVWAKYLNPRQLGMPLWTEAELIEGLRLIPRYAELQAGLQAVFDGSEPPDETIEAMMEIFEVESKKAETGMEKKDGRPPAAQDADKPDTYQKKAAGEKWVNKVFEVLVRNAIEEFGHIPRDVYRAITNLSEEKEKRDWEVEELTYSELRGLVKGFSKDHALDEFSHRVVVVYPRGTSSIYALDHWGMDFKSPRIWTAVKNKMQLVEDEHLRETVGLLRRFSEGSTLAGRIFEVAANNVLSRGESAPEPIAMNSQGNPPLFSGRTDLPSSSPRPSFTTARVITMVDFSKALTGVTLDGDRYYVPICSNHPLFDAFTVDLVGDKTALISVLQTTISQTHGGSANGYFNIRKIMMRVRELLTQSNMKGIELKVAYVLVCPEDELQHTWQMPGSWDKEISQNDHRGKPFCVRIPGFSGPSKVLVGL